MDISDTLAPDSDQLDACDLASGPQVFTVKSVSKGDPEQPVQVHLVEFPRGPWRPGKNMRRVLGACWGMDATAWVGRRVELYCDPTVRYGADAVGGTRIRALSNIDGQQKVPLIISRGKSAVYTVQPLASSTQTTGGEPVHAPGQTPASDIPAAQQSESAEPQESLRTAINRAIRAMQANDESAFLRTWCQAQGIPTPSSAAIEEKFGERARDLPALMAELPTDVTA